MQRYHRSLSLYDQIACTDQRLERYITELVNSASQREFRIRGHAYVTVPGLIMR